MKTVDDGRNMDVARRLRALRIELGPDLTVEEFASFFGVTLSSMNNWINGFHIPPIWAGIRIAKTAHVTLDWLYLGDGGGMSAAKSIRLHLLSERPFRNGYGTGAMG
jgi:hypothetical protein